MNKPITAIPQYDTYKDSGVDWLGEIPTGWEVKHERKEAMDALKKKSRILKHNQISSAKLKSLEEGV